MFLSDMYYLLGNVCFLVLVNEKVGRCLLFLTSSAGVLKCAENSSETQIDFSSPHPDDRVSIALLVSTPVET